MSEPAQSRMPPPARYGLPQAARATLFLVGLSAAGGLLRHLPLVGPFTTQLIMAALALVLLYQAGIKVTWLPPRDAFSKTVRLALLATGPLLLLASAYVHAEVVTAAARNPGALERLAATPVPVWVVAASFIKGGVMVPLAEELAFRGYLHTRLLQHDARCWRLGKAALSRAALVSGGLFAVIHLGNYLFARPAQLWLVAAHLGFAFVFGLVAAALLEKTESLLVPTVLHGVVNVWVGAYRMGLVAYLAGRL